MKLDPVAGLCPSCLFVQKVTSARGSEFLLCGRSRDDARFPRYPRLPVLRCSGYEPAAPDSDPDMPKF